MADSCTSCAPHARGPNDRSEQNSLGRLPYRGAVPSFLLPLVLASTLGYRRDDRPASHCGPGGVKLAVAAQLQCFRSVHALLLGYRRPTTPVQHGRVHVCSGFPTCREQLDESPAGRGTDKRHGTAAFQGQDRRTRLFSHGRQNVELTFFRCYPYQSKKVRPCDGCRRRKNRCALPVVGEPCVECRWVRSRPTCLFFS